MEITSTLTNTSGQEVHITYRNIESELDIVGKKVSAVHAFCFSKDQLVIVHDAAKRSWTPPGGSVEEGESVSDAIQREVREETNMKVVCQKVIGCQDITTLAGTTSQIRSACIVEPYGDFIADPDNDVTEIQLIDPKDYKKYFDWGAIGDRLMERALEAKAHLQAELDK